MHIALSPLSLSPSNHKHETKPLQKTQEKSAKMTKKLANVIQTIDKSQDSSEKVALEKTADIPKPEEKP
jgi:hypothetical protein